MATNSIINGTNLLVYVVNGQNLNCVGYSTSCSISISHNPRSTTNSTSGGWQTRMAGDRDWEVTVDAFIAMEADPSAVTNLNFYSFFSQYITARNPVVLRFGNEIADDYYYEGQAFLTGIELTGSNEESGTYSMTFIAAGSLLQLNNSGI
tara:strand:+ start:483 stop:932 length:450 start_codon:yes stop_codon:yes gene_type:complete